MYFLPEETFAKPCCKVCLVAKSSSFLPFCWGIAACFLGHYSRSQISGGVVCVSRHPSVHACVSLFTCMIQTHPLIKNCSIMLVQTPQRTILNKPVNQSRAATILIIEESFFFFVLFCLQILKCEYFLVVWFCFYDSKLNIFGF